MSANNYKIAGTYYLIGNLFNQSMTFLTVPIFTRILSTSDYGVVSTYSSWVAILAMIISFAIHMGIRAAAIDYQKKIDDFMAVSTTFTLSCGGIACIFIVTGSLLIRVNVNLTIVALCAIHGLAAALIQNYSMYLMMKFRYKFRSALMVLPNLLATIISIYSILFIVKDNLYLGRIVPIALVNILFGFVTVILVYSKSHVFYNKKYLKYALRISAPLVLHGIALSILSQSDRTMITWLADSSQTGIYSLIYNFGMLANVLILSMDGVWVPWFMNKYKNHGIDEINNLAREYVHVITCAMVVLILIGPEIIYLMAPEKYWNGIIIIPPIVLSNYTVFLYTLYVNVEHFHKKTIAITFNTIVAAISNLVLNFIFIPNYGYVAAAYTTLFSYLLSLFLHAGFAKRLDKNIYPMAAFIPSLFHILISILLFYMFLSAGVVRWVIVIVYILFRVFINRKKLIAFFPSLAEKLHFIRK
jgi:O-antigen/teichoic acid export membrane protein